MLSSITYEDKVALNENADIPDKNKIKAEDMNMLKNVINNNFNEILNLLCPIGRGFIDFTDTDYSNYLGFTWERELVGMTAVGLDVNDNNFNTIGKIGGSKEHSHIMPLGFDSNGYIYGKGDNENNPYYGSKTETVSNRMTLNPTTYQQNATVRIAYTSDGNSLQPYQVVAYWRRIA